MTTDKSDLPGGAIAVVGMACRVPGAVSVDEFWRNLRDGVESIVPLSEETLRAAGVPPEQFAATNYVRAAAVLEGMEEFDAEFFGLNPREAAIMDPQHRHFLECSWEALENAGYDPFAFDGSIGVFAGCGMQAYYAENLRPNRNMVDGTGLFLLRHTGNDKDFLSTRASYQFNLRGPSLTIQTACSTSLVAIHLAAQSLLSGECDMAIAGGVTIEVPHRQGYTYDEGAILSADGHCRAFDAAATGTVFGSGAGVVVLRPLDDAIAEGDTIHAILLGSAVNNDGAGKVSYLAPSVDGQAAAIAEALAVSGIPADSVTFLETHGTGTQIGDPIEIAALTQAYRESTDRTGFCALGALKTNIGHLDTAAGVAGFIKSVLALKYRQIPPTLHFVAPNPRIDFRSTPFFVNAQLRDWDVPGAGRRRAAVNSLGVGGTNAHVILEEAPALGETSKPVGPQLLVWSARTREGLDRQTSRFAEFIGDHPETNIADAAFTLQVGRHGFAHRRVLAVADAADALRTLRAPDKRRIFDAVAGERTPQLTFMFPGGGSQYPNMGRDLYESHLQYRTEVDRSLDLLKQLWGVDLRPLMFPDRGREGEAGAQLERPLNSIVSIFITEYALARLWMSWGVEPAIMTGHSLGEYTAACLAGVMSLESALAIVVRRGTIFEKLPEGAMLSVGLPEGELKSLLGPRDSIAAVNAPGMSVASGTLEAIADLEERLIDRGVDCQRLRISVAAHSAMLDEHLGDFRAAFDGIRLSPPNIPFVSNLTGEQADPHAVTMPEYWVRHLRETVRFSAGLATVRSVYPGCLFLEVGPGRSLSSTARLVPTDGAEAVAIPSMRHPKDPGSDLTTLLSAHGRLWASGAAVEWNVLHREQVRRRVPLPTYPFERKRHWIDAVEDGPAPKPATPAVLTRREKPEEWLAQTSWETVPIDAATRIDADLIVLLGHAAQFAAFMDPLYHDQAAEGGSLKVISVHPGLSFQLRSDSELTADFNSDEQISRLIQHACSQANQGVCFVLASPGSSPSRNGAAAREAESALFRLVRFAQRLGEGTEKRCWVRVVTREAFSVADETEVNPLESLSVGACRVIRRELKESNWKLIDLPKMPESARNRSALHGELAREILHDGSEREVALRARRRWVPGLVPYRWTANDGAPLLRDDGVYMITGGSGGLGLELARHLAATRRARLVLVSRSAEDLIGDLGVGGEIVRNLASTGVLCCSADVSDPASMRSAVDAAEDRFGAINGVFHCAGELRDALLLTKTPGDMARVLGPKFTGTSVLDELFHDRDLDFMVLYSSVSGWLGLPGQVDYAAANAFLDATAARASRNRRYPVLSLGWGAWRDVGMAARAVHLDSPRTSSRHPLVHRVAEVPGGPHQFYSTVDADDNWILDGHRTRDGVAVLPGAAYLELLRAAAQFNAPTRSLRIEDLVFASPLVVEGPTEVRLQIDDSDHRFEVSSRPVGGTTRAEWVDHAHGQLGILSGGGGARRDVARFRSRCNAERVFEPGEPATRQEQMIRFGERWWTLDKAWYGPDTAVGELSLRTWFVPELEETPLHPALLDIATAFALPIVEGYLTGDSFYVPLSYRGVTVHGPLEPAILSLVRCHNPGNAETVVFEIALVAPDGRPLVEIDEFVMKRLPDRLQVRQIRPAPAAVAIRSAAELTLNRVVADGIRPSDGVRVLDHLLREGCESHVLVSPYDLTVWSNLLDGDPGANGEAEPANDVRQSVVSQGRPDISTPFVAPAGEVEEALASIWKEALGLAEVGVDDNFFELGGHSLGLIRVIMKCRKAIGMNIPVADPALLENPTIKVMAAFGDDWAKGEPAPQARSIQAVSRERYRVD